MSGSRGEANFVWKCKNCKVLRPLLDVTESRPQMTNSNLPPIERVIGNHQGCSYPV